MKVKIEPYKDKYRATAYSNRGFVTGTLGKTEEEAREKLKIALTAFYDYPVKIKEDVPKEYINKGIKALQGIENNLKKSLYDYEQMWKNIKPLT